MGPTRMPTESKDDGSKSPLETENNKENNNSNNNNGETSKPTACELRVAQYEKVALL